MSDDFWERGEVVERFADRDPDHRLARIVKEYADPGRVRVLDLGCAGGRNTARLAELGFDVRALDASAAMVERTRSRVEAILGAAEARERVCQGAMDDLGAFDDRSCDLVVALGVYHNARTHEEWRRAIAETARVLKPGGRVLVNQFTPATDLTGDGVHPVAGEPHVYEGLPGGRAVLVDRTALDAAFARHGLRPVEAGETVAVLADPGRRVSVNALYGSIPPP